MELNQNHQKIDEKYIDEQIKIRKQAKIDKNWTLCDKIRDHLLNDFNIILEDSANGNISWKIKS